MEDPHIVQGNEKQEYVDECECPEIQESWSPVLKDEIFDKLTNEFILIEPGNMPSISKLRRSGRLVFLPSLEWLAERMADMYPERHLDAKQLLDGVLSSFYWAGDKSPRLALIKELKAAIVRERKRREGF
ncbi:MAG: hypothetical protein JW957_05140 [Candidatus Omnitrophica bacterium]|nr:hypothetical protein [Candidatus Omnitrophota bacterium]